MNFKTLLIKAPNSGSPKTSSCVYINGIGGYIPILQEGEAKFTDLASNGLQQPKLAWKVE